MYIWRYNDIYWLYKDVQECDFETTNGILFDSWLKLRDRNQKWNKFFELHFQQDQWRGEQRSASPQVRRSLLRFLNHSSYWPRDGDIAP